MSQGLDAIALENVRIQERAKENREAMQPPAPPPQDLLDAQRVAQKFESIQQSADPVYRKYGKPAPERDPGELLMDYRVRLLDGIKANTSLAKRDFSREPSDALLDSERQVYAEAAQEQNWRHPGDLKRNEWREVVFADQSGRKVHEFVTGKDSKLFREFFGPFMSEGIHSSIHLNGQAMRTGITPNTLPQLPAHLIHGWD